MASIIRQPEAGSGSPFSALKPPRKLPSSDYDAAPAAGSVLAAGGTTSQTRNMGPFGEISVDNSYQLPLEGYDANAQADRADRARFRNLALEGLSSLNRGGAGSPVSLDSFAPSPAVSRVSGESAEAEAAARNAAFARAKETAGNTARASLTGLYDELQRRGMGGGGYEAGEIANRLVEAADQTGEVTRDQAISDAGRATHVADEEFGGQLAQRQEDQRIRLAVRQQNLSAAEAEAARNQQALQGLISAYSRLY